MTRNIFLSSCAIIFAGIFFVINDAIINFLSSINIQFYHFIFYGTPAFIAFPIYLIFTGQFIIKMSSTNYWIPLIRGVLFAPMPLFTFIALKNITLPEYTTLNMSSPLVATLLAIFFLKEKLNKKRIISISLVIIATIYLLFDFSSLPWVGFTLAFLWSIYNLLRKKISVETDIGLLIESLFILPLAILFFYFIVQANQNDFSLANPTLMALIFLAGPMTVIPLFLYVKGVELSGLGPSGMIFFITPTCQFLLGFFYYNEEFSLNKLISFIIIWIAVSIYLKDLYENN